MIFNSFIKIAFALSILFWVTSCTTENDIENKPSNFIEKEEFADLLYELNILEGSFSNLNMNQNYMKDSAMKMYKGLFEDHGVTFEASKENQDYYILTSQYKEISDSVLVRIKAEEEKYKGVVPVKIISFTQFSEFLEKENYLNYFETDTLSTYAERLDSILSYYRVNPDKLKPLKLDSVAFETNIIKLKKGVDLFQIKESVFKKSIKK